MNDTRDKSGEKPTLEFNWQDENIRAIAENIYHAQQAGWPAVLHYSKQNEDLDRKKKRTSAMRVDYADVVGQKDKAGAEDKDYAMLAEDVKKHGALHIPTIRNSDPSLNLPSRDEYPFACTKEHAGKVWVGHVPPQQNSRQGQMIQSFLKQHQAPDGFEFRVSVVGRPEVNQTGRIKPK